MVEENPYRSPPDDEQEDIALRKNSERPVYASRWEAAWAGMRRGMKLGMIAITGVFGLLMAILLIGYSLDLLPRSAFPKSWLVFGFQAGLIIFSGGFFYGAIPGGFFMALIEISRFKKSNNPREDTEPEKQAKRPVFATRRQATWAGMRRGPVLGMVIATVLSAISLFVMPLTQIVLLIAKTEDIFSSLERFFTFLVIMPISSAVFLASWFVTAIECAIFAGIIMGLVEAIRYHKPA